MKKVRVTALIICIIVTISMTGLLVYAGANEGSGQTPEFGTFSWSLGHEVTHPISRTYNVRVEGITSITKYSAGTTVIVKIEVQDNKTGTPLYTCIDSKTNAPTAKTLTKSNILPHHEFAAFGCHEARGKNAIVRYTCTTF